MAADQLQCTFMHYRWLVGYPQICAGLAQVSSHYLHRNHTFWFAAAVQYSSAAVQQLQSIGWFGQLAVGSNTRQTKVDVQLSWLPFVFEQHLNTMLLLLPLLLLLLCCILPTPFSCFCQHLPAKSRAVHCVLPRHPSQTGKAPANKNNTSMAPEDAVQDSQHVFMRLASQPGQSLTVCS